MKKILILLLILFLLFSCDNKNSSKNKETDNSIEAMMTKSDLEGIKQYFTTHPDELNKKMSNGSYPLHYAVELRNSNILELLLTFPTIDIDIQSDKNETALDFSRRFLNISDHEVFIALGYKQTTSDILIDALVARNPLLTAVRDKKMKDITLLIGNEKIKGYLSLGLRMACKEGNLDMTRILVENGANINSQSWGIKGVEATLDINTPFLLAVKSNNIDLVKYLLDKKIDYSVSSQQYEEPNVGALIGGFNALMIAVENQNIEMVKLLYNHNPKVFDMNKISYGYQTALMIASRYSDIEIVKYLVDKGADVNYNEGYATEQVGFWTPLFVAVFNKNYSIAKYLIDKGADVNCIVISEYKETPLSFCLSENDADPEFIRLLMSKKAKLVMSTNTKIEQIKKYIEYGRSINDLDANGETFLTGLVEQSNINAIKELLALGIDKGNKNKDGKTALDIAIKNKDEDIINLLK